MQTNLKAKALEALSRNEDEAALKEVGDKIMRACTADKKWSFHWQNRICSFVRFETRGELGNTKRKFEKHLGETGILNNKEC